ncbi:hypothetical protein BGZ59_010974, partial [Podila verticillata]
PNAPSGYFLAHDRRNGNSQTQVRSEPLQDSGDPGKEGGGKEKRTDGHCRSL